MNELKWYPQLSCRHQAAHMFLQPAVKISSKSGIQMQVFQRQQRIDVKFLSIGRKTERG